MIENIKRTLLPKTGIREKQVLQDPGYATCQHCQYMHAARKGPILIVFTLYVNTVNTYNRITM